MKILLVNYNHNVVGGCETMYKYLHRAFPNSELISCLKMFKGESLKEISKQLDEYIIERNEKEDILVIKEAELGGVLDTSSVAQINIFQNPFRQLSNRFNLGYDPWVIDKSHKFFGKNVTVSNYMKNELKMNNVNVIPNCVDMAVFKPIEKSNLRIKYNIPEGQRVGVWVGFPSPVKNFQMLLNLIEYFPDIFWILISKEDFNSPYPNSKVFSKINNKEVNELLNCADFFILTSTIESCGISVFEAMACNLPCIISKAGYFLDFFDEKIGIQVSDSDNFNEHKDAVEKINKIKTDSRKVLISQLLDYNTWKSRWEAIING